MYHKIMILAAAIGAVSILVNYFFNGADFDVRGILIMAIVIVNELRGLQYDKLKDQYDTMLVTLTSFRNAVFAECDDETIDRITLKQADNIVDMAPEEYQPELSKVNDLLKKMHKFKYGVEHAHHAKNS